MMSNTLELIFLVIPHIDTLFVFFGGVIRVVEYFIPPLDGITSTFSVNMN